MRDRNTIDGKVLEALGGGRFKVELRDGNTITAHVSGKMRMHYIKVIAGDYVDMVLSPDGRLGRITRRK